MLGAGELVIRRIEPAPARTGEVNLRPSVGGSVLAYAHLYIAGNKSRTKPPMPGSLHHEHREISAGAGPQSNGLTRKLNTRFLPPNVLERLEDSRIQPVEQFESVNELPGR